MYLNDRIFKRLQIQPKFPRWSEDGIVGRRKSVYKGSEAGMNLATARNCKETTRLESSEGARGRGQVRTTVSLVPQHHRVKRLRPPTV